MAHSSASHATVRHLDLSRGIGAGTAPVTVKLTLSQNESAALKIRAAEDARFQVQVDPVTGVVTLTGDAASIQAALMHAQLEIKPGYTHSFKLDIAVSGGQEHQERVILYFEQASGQYVPMYRGGGGASSAFYEEAASGWRAKGGEDAAAAFAGARGREHHGSDFPPQPGVEESGEAPQVTAILTLPPVELRPGYQLPPGDFPQGILTPEAPVSSPVQPPVSLPPVTAPEEAESEPTPTPPPSLGGTGILFGGGGGPVARSFILTPGIDDFVGDALADTFQGAAADWAVADTLYGAGGSDILRITGGAASFNPGVQVNVRGIETFDLQSTGAHSVTLTDAYYNSAGFDGGTFTVTTGSNVGITVNASAVTQSSHVLDASGGGGADTLGGGGGGDTLTGGGGADSLSGGAGDNLTRSLHTPYNSGVNFGTGAYTTAAFTPSANSLLVVVAGAMENNGTGNIGSGLTILDSQGLTWTQQIVMDNTTSWAMGMSVWTAPVTAGVATTVTVDCGAFDIYGYTVDVLNYTGYDTLAPVGGKAQNTNGPVDGVFSFNLSSAPESTSEVLGIMYTDTNGAQTVAPGTGWTELGENRTDPTNNMQHLETRAGSTSAAVSWNDVQELGGTVWKSMFGALEIKAGATGGSDRIVGGGGADTIQSYGGNDTIAYAAVTDSGIGAGNRDIILDFAQGRDVMDLSTLPGAATFRAGGNGAADFVAGFQVAYQQAGGNTIVFVDADGNNAADFEIQLTGLMTLTAVDFVL